MAVEVYFAWGQNSASVAVGETVAVPVTADVDPSVAKLSALFSPYAVVDSATASSVVIRGVSAGSITVNSGRDISPQSMMDMSTYPDFTLTVTAPVDDESYLNKRGLAHFWGNIDDIKQDKLTAGANITIASDNTISSSQPAATTSSLGVVQVGSGLAISSGGVLSATGGGVADSVAWGHITGTMADQTDLNTALGAKANSADLATVATSGSYNDLSNKPTIPTVNNATLTIQKNGTTVKTFTANASSNVTANITVPVNVSDLTNDSGYLTSVSWGDVTGKPTFATVATTGSYDDLLDKPTLSDEIFFINAISFSGSDGTYTVTLDKTYSEIMSAYQDGKFLVVCADVNSVPDSGYPASSNDYVYAELYHVQKSENAGSTSTSFFFAAGETSGNGRSITAHSHIFAIGEQHASYNRYFGSITVTDTVSNVTNPVSSNAVYNALATKANSADLATVATSGSYNDLTGKPTIGNATLIIQKNGTSAGTFTANATSNKTINITVPTTAADVSALPASTKYGASIAVSINTTDYKVTTTLKDQDGNTLGTAQVIDLPLESVVVNGSYDNTNKKIVLTLQNGNTIDIPVADLVAGLQSEITSANKLASDLVDDTNQTNKFMTSAEKTKLSGIAAGAEVNVQSDWDQTTTTADDYIKNKPTLATVATSGSYNDLSNKPTNVSAFTNDAGYITSYTDNKTAQTLTKPTTSTTYYPVASASSSTNTADVKKFSGVSLSYSDNEGGAAELTLGKTSLNGSVAGSISLIDSVGATGHTTISGSGKSSTGNHTLNAPNTSGRLVANSSSSSATGSATNPVYADGDGILHATTYTLEKSVPSNAVFTDTTYSDATTSVAGLMSAADKTKLNGIATGAEVNQNAFSNVKVGSTTVAADSKTDTLELVAGSNVTITPDATNDKVTIAATDTTYSDATTSTHGLMSAADKTKLNGIATGAEVNVQSDWSVTDTASDAFIKNKPTIPTVNNGTLTIQKNGTAVATFTANQSGNATANITVPTIDDVVEIDKTLAAVTDWTNTGIQGADLETGTYVVQVFTGSAYAGTWQERWSGIMSWYSGNTNSGNTEEILLHNAGHADNSQNLFLRTKRDGVTVSGTKYLTLQYAFSQANETTTTIKFSFRRII